MTTLLTLPSLETPNLVLREMRGPDARDLSGFMTQPRYQKHIAHRLRDEAEVADFVRRQVAVQGDGRRQVYHLAAEEKMSGEVVGEGFIILHSRNGHELGWGVHPAMWSMGLGTEVARALLGLAFERMGAEMVWCKIMDGNRASTAVARRIGLIESERRADMTVAPGRLADVTVYSLTASQYYDLPY